MDKHLSNTLLTRLVLVNAALGLQPDQLKFFEQVVRHGLSVCLDLNSQQEPSWTLYVFDPEERCPLNRVQMAPWLVEGIAALMNNRNFDFETIDPKAIVSRARDVCNNCIPVDLAAPVYEIIDALEAGAVRAEAQHPGMYDEMRKALRIKGMAVDEHLATGTHKEYKDYEAQVLT